MRLWIVLLVFGFLAPCGAAPAPDERAAKPGEWGGRPADESVSERNPPSFSWRPQKGAVRYHLQVARDASFAKVDYEGEGIAFNVHCPDVVLEAGAYSWRFRFSDAKGVVSTWSMVRRFSIAESAVRFPIPTREEVLAKIPDGHPRLFLRPEDLPGLRERAKGDLKEHYGRLRRECDGMLKKPVSTAEPPTYPAGVKGHDERWRVIWWGNRTQTIATLNAAAKLGFVYRLSGERKYGDEASCPSADAGNFPESSVVGLDSLIRRINPRRCSSSSA